MLGTGNMQMRTSSWGGNANVQYVVVMVSYFFICMNLRIPPVFI